MKYWIGQNGQQLGPFSVPEIQKMMQEGRITNADLAWADGMPSWAPVFDVVKPAGGGSTAVDLAKTQPALAQYNPVQAAPSASPAPSPSPMSSPSPSPDPSPSYGMGAAPSPAPSPSPYASPAPAPAPYASPAPAPAPMAQSPMPPAPSPYMPPPPAPEPQPWAPPPPQQQYGPPPPAQQPWAQQPQYGAPPPGGMQGMGMPQGMAPVGMSPMSGPIPPGMNWILCLVLMAFIPFFSLIWLFIEAGFVQKIDPQTKAKKFYVMAIVAIFLAFVLIFAGAGLGVALGDSAGAAVAAILPLIGMLGYLGGFVMIILGHFKMRDSLVTYYNTMEPIGLRLSGVMTFFFNIIYFQYHFQRIADWKKTGQLRPQG